MTFSIFAAFFVYFSVLLVICYLAHRKNQTESDFVIGSRSLNFWLTAFSAHAADMSAWLFMAFPAAIFIGGMPNVWIALGLFLGMYLNWQFIAPSLRVKTEALKSDTLSTFFSHCYGDQGGILRIGTALASIFFLTWYLSAGLIAMGLLFESMFGVDYWIGITIATAAAITYTFIGGFVTVAWTDLFQGCFLLGMILLVPILAIFEIGGLSAIESAAAFKNLSLSPFGDGSVIHLASALCLSFGWGLGYFGQPHIITKFMGIRDPKEIHKSKYVGMLWQFLALGGAVLVGLSAIAYFPNGIANDELVFVELVHDLFHPFLGSIVLCAILAANISTMDSQLLVCASVVSEDFFKVFKKVKFDEKKLLWISKSSVIVIALIAFVLSTSKSASVKDNVFYAWMGLGSSFGPLLLMGLFYPRINFRAGLVGLIVGVFFSATWDSVNPYITGYNVPALIPSFFLSLLSIYLLSNRK